MNPSKDTLDFLKNYVNLKTDIVLLNISKKLTDAAALFVFAIIMGFILIFISLFLSLSLSSWLADVLNMPGMGNLIVSAIYTIIAIVLYKFRFKLIINPIRELMANAMDFSDLHNDSSIRKDENIDAAIIHVQNKLQETEKNIDQNFIDIKKYYSFDELKDRFIQSIYNDPKSILSTLMILREVIKSRKKKNKK